MNDYKYHYLFTTFVSISGSIVMCVIWRLSLHSLDSIHLPFQDIESFDLEDFKYNFVNITAFRLIDADDVDVRSILKDMERYQPAGNTILNKSRIIQVSIHMSYVYTFSAETVEILRDIFSYDCAFNYKIYEISISSFIFRNTLTHITILKWNFD